MNNMYYLFKKMKFSTLVVDQEPSALTESFSLIKNQKFYIVSYKSSHVYSLQYQQKNSNNDQQDTAACRPQRMLLQNDG